MSNGDRTSNHINLSELSSYKKRKLNSLKCKELEARGIVRRGPKRRVIDPEQDQNMEDLAPCDCSTCRYHLPPELGGICPRRVQK